MLDYSLIVALKAVEREGSFRGAARFLEISASAVSQQIRLLEERIGAIVVERGNPIRPTQIGYSLCRHADEVLSLEHKIKRENDLIFSGELAQPTSIKIVVNADSLACWFVHVMQQEFSKNPNWLFDIRCRNHDETQSDLLTGRSLVAVTTEKKAPQGFRSTYLGIHRYRAVAGVEFAKRYFSDGINETTLATAPTLSGGHDDLQSQWLFKTYKKEIVTLTHRIPQSMSFIEATKKNIGWSVNPTELVQEGIESGELIELLPDSTLDKKIYWQYSRAISDSVQPITDTIVSVARRNLMQEDVPIYKVKLSKPIETEDTLSL